MVKRDPQEEIKRLLYGRRNFNQSLKKLAPEGGVRISRQLRFTYGINVLFENTLNSPRGAKGGSPPQFKARGEGKRYCSRKKPGRHRRLIGSKRLQSSKDSSDCHKNVKTTRREKKGRKLRRDYKKL